MNAFDYSDLLPPLLLGVVNLFFAGVLHRTIVRNSALLRRRHFYESLALLAFALALILMVAGFALWRENPRFVYVCTGVWVLICLIAVGVLRHRSRDDELALPDLWPTTPEHANERVSGAVNPIEPVSPRPTDATRGRTLPLDAFTRARLKKARRERSTGDGRFRKNRSVYTDDNSGKREPPDREGS